MRKLSLLTVLLLSSFYAAAQWPYFQREHTSATAGITYSGPVDIHHDGATKVYSYHSTSTGGTVVAKYNSGTGNITDIVYLAKSGVSYTPVRVRTQGSDYYALFNFVSGSYNRFALIKLNATTNALVFLRQFTDPSGTMDEQAVDFILDGGSYAYILGNTYDAVNNQTDLVVTKVDVSTATPAIIWAMTYQNTTRDEFGSNIILYNNSLYASCVSVSTSSMLDRGPALLKIATSGLLVNSRTYKYSSTCTSVRSSGTWVLPGNGTLYLSSISYVGADGNGPLWLAKIDPVTLGLTLQAHHSSGAAYMNPEIQIVRANAGDQILMSGSAPFVNTATPGYVHYYFNPTTLAFSSGTKYTTTAPSLWSGQIYDAYINSGVGMNVFSVAAVYGTPANYYLLKTSDLGDNACDVALSVPTSACVVDQYDIPFIQRDFSQTVAIIKLFTISLMTNSYTESCFVSCPGCEYPVMPNEAESSRSAMTSEATLWPNPTTGKVMLRNATEASGLQLTTLLGEQVEISVIPDENNLVLDLTAQPKGVYLLQYFIGNERFVTRIIKE